MALIVITGTRGDGKTSFVRSCVEHAARCGWSTGGIISPAVLEAGQRVGYDIESVRSAERRRLAMLVDDPRQKADAGRYSFAEDAVRFGNETLVAAAAAGCEVIAIDEVGPLELRGGGWAPALRVALERHRKPQSLFIVIRTGLIEEVAANFPSAAWAGVRRVAPPWPDPAEVFGRVD